MMIFLAVSKFDYGPMKKAEDMFKEIADEKDPGHFKETKGKVIHLVIPIIILIISCVIGMIYTGGFFEGVSFADAFAASDASVGLVFGSVITLVLTIIFYLFSKVLSFKECMNSLPEGFKSMVPAILILVFAWTLKSMTNSLGSDVFVSNIVNQFAKNNAIMSVIPAVVFIIGCFISFATGTSWGTFGILIPIVVKVFNYDATNTLMIISVSACMAGAVCGDHCSPISDTTIMASAGAHCEHINHVSTQLPYALTCASISLVSYIVAGFVRNALLCLGIGVFIEIIVLMIIKNITTK